MEIHTFGNGDVIASILTGLKILMLTGPYTGLLLLGSLILAMLAIGNVFAEKPKNLALLLGVLVIYAITTQITADVLVVDEVNPDVADQIVTGVPLAVALPAYVSGYAGWQFTRLVETAFAVPITYSVGKSTPNRPLFDLQKILAAKVTDAQLEMHVQEYFVNCVMKEMDYDQNPPIAGLIDEATFTASPNILAAMVAVSGGFSVYGVPCPTYYGSLVVELAAGSAGYDRTRRYLQTQLQVLPTSTCDDECLATNLITYLLPVTGQTGLNLINNSMLIKSWRHAEMIEKSRYKDASASTAELQKSITLNLKEQAFNTSHVVQKMLPMLRTVVEGIIYAATPMVLVFALSPGMGGFMGLYLKMFLWLQTWGPLYAIINLVVFQEAKSRLANMTVAGGFSAVTVSSYDSYVEFVSMMNSATGDYIWMVPALGWALVWGGSSVGSALGNAGRTAQQTGQQTASEFAVGQGRTMLEGSGHTWEPKTLSASGDLSGGFIGDSGGSKPFFSPRTGSFGPSVMNQSGVISHRGADGSQVEIAPNGNRMITDVSGTRQYSGDGVLQSGVFRPKEGYQDSVSGQKVFPQIEALGNGQSRATFQVDMGSGPVSVQSLLDKNGRETDRQVKAVRGGVEYTGNSSAQSPLASVRASGSTPIFAVFGQGDKQRIVPITGNLEGTGTEEKTNDPSRAVLSSARVTSNIDNTKSMSGPVTFDGKNYSMQVTGGEENEQFLRKGFVDIGGDHVPISSTFSPTDPSKPGSLIGSFPVSSKPIYAPDGSLAGNFTGELKIAGQSIAADSEGRLLAEPVNDPRVFSLSGHREGSSEHAEVTGKIGLDGGLTFDRLNETHGHDLNSIGTIPLGKDPSAPVFRGEASTSFVNGHEVMTLGKGTVSYGDQTSRVMSGTVEDGKPIELSTSDGPQQFHILPGGAVMHITGDPQSAQGAQFKTTWPSHVMQTEIGKTSDGKSIVEPRAFSHIQTGIVRTDENGKMTTVGENNSYSEKSARGSFERAGSVQTIDGEQLVKPDGTPLNGGVLPVSKSADGHIVLNADKTPTAVFIPSAGTGSRVVEERTPGTSLGQATVDTVTNDPVSGTRLNRVQEGGSRSDMFLDQEKLHANSGLDSSVGWWGVHLASDAKHLSSDQLTEKYGEWAGSVVEMMKSDGYDPDNSEHRKALYTGLELAEKGGDLINYSSGLVFRFKSIAKMIGTGGKAKKMEGAANAYRQEMLNIQRERNQIMSSRP